MQIPTEDALTAELCRRSFFEFFLEFWETIEPVRLVLNWHIKVMCDELQEICEAWERAEAQPDALFNVPPGTTKSTTVTQLFPAWVQLRNPSARIISSSYASSLSVGHAVKTRDCLRSPKFQRLYPGLIDAKEDEDGKTSYRNTRGGQRYATSTGGAVTGVHGDFIIIDDPLNPAEMGSESALVAAKTHLQTLSTRKTDKERSVTIMVMQRLHEKDPAGLWLGDGRPLRHICLPGEVSKEVRPAILASQYVDGLLDPVRLSRAALAKLKVALGSYGYAGQVMQRPSPEEGGIIKKTWFGSINWDQFCEMTKGQEVVWDYDFDTAYTKNQENDPTAGMATSYVGQTLYLREVVEVWEEMPGLIRFIPTFVGRNGCSDKSRLFVEPKAAGKSTVQNLREGTELNVIEAPAPTDDKVTRAHNASPFIEAGRVVLIYGEPGKQGWHDAFIDQCCTFPRAAHDDQLDDLTQAIARTMQNTPDGGTRALGTY